MSTPGGLAARLALHTWTLDTTPLADLLRVARETGWTAVELRRVDFERAARDGQGVDQVVDLVRASGLKVAAVGIEMGWMFADQAEWRRLRGVYLECREVAVALQCGTLMNAADLGRGDLARAADRLKDLGDLAAERSLRLAIEPPSQAEHFNSVERIRELAARADHPHVGLLLDTYHLQRSGDGLRALEELDPAELFYFQYSDVPADPLPPGQTVNRLPPGRGVVPFSRVFQVLREKGYEGYLSYEAPNREAWADDPEKVASEALAATRRLIGP